LKRPCLLYYKKKTEIVGAGRTDAGVHAEKMIAHVAIESEIEPEKFVYQLNALLSNDIVIHDLYQVKNDVHARFDAISRTYEYRIYLGRNPFLLDTSWQINQQLDIEKMNEAAALIFNYTNFKCFSKSKTDVKTYNCKIMEAFWEQKGQLLTFHIKADRFLRNMVRAIVGTMIEVGEGKTTPNQFTQIIESENRSEAGCSVPAQGLFLVDVCY